MLGESEVISNLESDNRILGKTFFWMFLGLLGSGIVAAYTYYSGLFVDIIMGGYWNALLVLELVVVLLFSFLFKKLSPTAVGILFFIYSMINGVTLCTVFAIFELTSVVSLFIASSVIFAVLGYIGYNTNKNLSSWSTYLSVFLIIGIVLSFVNLFFLKSSSFDLILDWVILALFFGITIYDMNKIKVLQESELFDTNKIHIYCAMQLYLDFINIFLRIISIFGKRRD